MKFATCNKLWKINLHRISCTAKCDLLNIKYLRPCFTHTRVHFTSCHRSWLSYFIKILMSENVYQRRMVPFLIIASWFTCIQLKSHYWSLIRIDVTHFYRKYIIKLITSYDVDKQIFPMCIVFVYYETTCSWTCFLKSLRQHITKNQRPIFIIFDRPWILKGMLLFSQNPERINVVKHNKSKVRSLLESI